MFSSLGLFRNVQCPKHDDCDLPTCIFSHAKQNQVNPIVAEEYDPFDTGYVSPPPAKRLKTDHEAMSTEVRPWASPAAISSPKADIAQPGRSERTMQPVQTTSPLFKLSRPEISATPSTKPTHPGPKPTKPATATRPISPPPVKPKPQPAAKKVGPPKKEVLAPRNVPSQPALFSKRDYIVKQFYATMQMKDKMSAGGDSRWKALLLSEQELIKYALDREEEAARKYEGTFYQSHLGGQMGQFKKMTAGEWRSFVQEVIRGEIEKPTETKDKPAERPSTGLGSLDEEVAILRAIRTSLAGLEKFGYVTSPPTAQEIASARAAADSSGGWEQCDRCGTRFRVFPGRDEEGRLTSGGMCQYHWARPSRPSTQRLDRVTGGGQVAHPCCSQPPGSAGCTEAETHVFTVKDAKRMAGILQFETTPPNPDAVKGAVSFDCEMGYTSLGMEVIRVTAVSWPGGKQLLDVLVRPYGEILDFNTRFSGVSQKQFVNAAAYGEEVDCDDTSEDGELEPEPLRKVESPAAARQLLFNLIGPETPLIGHAIDNDLNTLRIIHPLIVDTVLLYPHPKGLPIRFGLKALTRQHLDRGIQMSGAAGHDSKEDAVATGDLVTLKVAEKWRQMKSAGWRFEEGKLVPPESL